MDRWNNICRSCLITAESFSYFIYENISPEIYFYCTSIEVKRDDLPKSLCTGCYDLLKQFYEFKKICIKSENQILEYSNSLKLKSETEVNLKTEVEDIDTKVDVTEVLVKREKSDGENNDASEPYFSDHIDTQDQDDPFIREKAIKINRKDLKGVNKKRRKRPFNFSCELCSKKFVFKERFEAHKLKHEGKIAPIHCEPCDKTFETWSGLRRHNVSDHSLHSFKDLTCKVCFKVCKTPSTLKIHYKTHEERKVQICDECGREFKSHLTLKNHLETHTKNRQRNFTCQHCGKKYVSKKTRAKHIYRRHTNRRFLCHYCNYPFGDKSNLIKHIMIHEGKQRLYKCDLCFRALTSSASLVVHKRIHSGERPFSCNFCPKRFSNRGMLVEHQRTHTGEKPYKCVVCEQSFTQRGSMKRHMKVHDRLCA